MAMFVSKWRQVGFGLGHPRATVGYPLAPLAPDPAYRGRVTVDTDLCTGCGGCADVCPARCIEIHDPSRAERVIVRRLDRCLLCGRCEDACAYDAVHLVADWETATPDRAALVIEQHLFMGACDRCGRCAIPAHPLDHVVVGLRDGVPAPAGPSRARAAAEEG
jgi:formate hydrogenlyase subunit 6/NADH:ubiquinone oxidoreductase subunit I